jgi:hypothetical protein
VIRLPLREAVVRSAAARAGRAAQLRLVLGPVAGWPEDWVVELRERVAIAELDGGLDPDTAEREATDALRADLLRRVP